MREERFPWGLGAILVLAIVGGIGFWVGSSSVAPVIVPVAAPVAPAPVAPAPVSPIYPVYAPHGGGFPLFPLFFGLIFVVVIFKFIRHAAWSGYQRGGPWAGGGSGGATYGPGGATYGPAGGPGGATYGPGGASYGPGGFGGRGSRSRHHRGHSGYGTGFDDDSVDQSQEGSQDTASASEATRPSDAARSGRPGFWNGRDVPPMVDEMFQRWHSRMHAEAEPETKGESDAPDTQSADDAGGSLNIPPAAQPTDQQN